MNPVAIGRRLINLRGAKTREEVCADLHISVSALQMYENGKRIPCDNVKIKLARYYNVGIEFLFFSD